MPRLLLFLLFTLLLCQSCKKDLLAYKNVQQLNSHTADRLNRILFVNDTFGFIVGGQRTAKATILTTKDGGYTWSYQDLPQDSTGIYGITQSPTGWLYTIGYNGRLGISKDTGKSWIFRTTYRWEMIDIAYSADNYGTAVGGINFSGGYFQNLNPDGSLDRQYYYHYQLNRIKMVGNTGYLGGYGIFQKTTDGGRTWQSLSISADDFWGIDLHDNGNTLWVCGYNGCIYHSTDGGANWHQLRDGNDATRAHYHLLDILFTDNLHGYACGENGILISTDDGGHHWAQYTHFTDNALRSLALCANGDLLAAGDNGTLFRLKP